MEVHKNRIKKVVLVALFLIGLILVVYPFVPNFQYFFRTDSGKKEIVPYKSELYEKGSSTAEVQGKPIPEDNRLVIPKISVDVAIVEGSDENALLKGAWHRPTTGDPEKGGNFVITGHRFRYLPPNNTTFYSLDRIGKGDRIIVYWNGSEYDYEVKEILTVDQDAIEIEQDLGYNAITLYTCTPLWTSEKRLVVRAAPISN